MNQIKADDPNPYPIANPNSTHPFMLRL